MRLPIDTSGLAFTLVSVAPVRDWETKQAKGDKDGVPLFAVRLFALAAAAGEGDVIKVTVAGEPSGVVPGGSVRVRELTAQPYSIEGKSGGGVPRRRDRGRHAGGQRPGRVTLMVFHAHTFRLAGHVKRCADPDCLAWEPLPLAGRDSVGPVELPPRSRPGRHAEQNDQPSAGRPARESNVLPLRREAARRSSSARKGRSS